MPNIKSAIKRVKTNENKREQNSAFKSAMRTTIKRFEAAVEQNDEQAKKELYAQSVKYLDRAAGKGIIHKNNANRQKARLAKQLA